jgi:putative FmdB family regulatory protein
MPLYAYKCRNCSTVESQRRADWITCPECGVPARRLFMWNNASVLMDHYNPAFGQVISSRRQAAELAKRASEDQSKRLGMTVNYELTDIHDHEAAGITKDEKVHYAGESKAAMP